MGVDTDFIIAEPSEAQRLGDDRRAFDGYPAKGIDQVRMGTLHAIVTGRPYDLSFMVNEASFTYSASDDGPWVQTVPTDMVAGLAALSPADIRRVGDEWFKTDEFQSEFSRYGRDDVATFLTDLHRLSSEALRSGKALFMWTSL